jgi:cellulose synthase/poly-beta-1,6-N-acetylglucosamine synthase-like glycosyltransferase
MMIIAAVIFWLSFFALLHSYVLYPLILQLLASGKKKNAVQFTTEDDLPVIIVLMAVYNEEAVLQQKIDSIFATKYPKDKLQVYIGSDASTDRTNDILEQNRGKYHGLYPVLFKNRTGKISIINTLHNTVKPVSNGAILLMTDANVLFDPDTLFHLVKNFKEPSIGLVAANVLNSGVKHAGISFQEKSYVQRENNIKYHEGLIWGTMMGAFGACYAMRAELYHLVPEGYKVDDFYITLSVLQKGRKTIAEPNALCYEDVSDEVSEEFRRKSRIATGNFQNLAHFSGLLWPPYAAVAFTFFSHKVIRWFGPFLLLALLFSNAFLLEGNIFYVITFTVQSVLALIPFVDNLLKRFGVHLVILRFIAYFYYMNLALLAGFIKYLKGDKKNVWQPTKRNQ